MWSMAGVISPDEPSMPLMAETSDVKMMAGDTSPNKPSRQLITGTSEMRILI
jgi:hypothetical protein